MALVSGNKPNKYCSIGLLAHVDAGKTTLSEGLLYAAGAIREMGRVDKRVRTRTSGMRILTQTPMNGNGA